MVEENNMSQAGIISVQNIIPIGTLETLTGNSGGAVGPTASNINIVASAGSGTFAGNPGTSTLTYTAAALPPTTVFFSAIATVSNLNETGDGTAVVVPFDSTVSNVGGGFNVGTSEFSAPDNGIYAFYTGVTTLGYDTSHDSLAISFVGSAETNIGGTINPGVIFTAPSGFVTQTLSTVLLMTAGDTLNVTIIAGGDTKTVGIFGSVPPAFFTYFRGYRVA
jgi:hypothetical protein